MTSGAELTLSSCTVAVTSHPFRRPFLSVEMTAVLVSKRAEPMFGLTRD